MSLKSGILPPKAVELATMIWPMSVYIYIYIYIDLYRSRSGLYVSVNILSCEFGLLGFNASATARVISRR